VTPQNTALLHDGNLSDVRGWSQVTHNMIFHNFWRHSAADKIRVNEIDYRPTKRFWSNSTKLIILAVTRGGYLSYDRSATGCQRVCKYQWKIA